MEHIHCISKLYLLIQLKRTRSRIVSLLDDLIRVHLCHQANDLSLILPCLLQLLICDPLPMSYSDRLLDHVIQLELFGQPGRLWDSHPGPFLESLTGLGLSVTSLLQLCDLLPFLFG